MIYDMQPYLRQYGNPGPAILNMAVERALFHIGLPCL